MDDMHRAALPRCKASALMQSAARPRRAARVITPSPGGSRRNRGQVSQPRVTLTAAGRALLPRARGTLDAARAARDAVYRVQGTLHGTVTVGTLTAINLIDLPGLLAALRARHPGITVRLRTAATGSAGLAQDLHDGQIDVAFLSLPRPPPPRPPLRPLAAAPASHPLAGVGRATLSQLAVFPFIDSPPGFGNRLLVDQAFAAAGVEREVTLEIADIGMAASFIRAG